MRWLPLVLWMASCKQPGEEPLNVGIPQVDPTDDPATDPPVWPPTDRTRSGDMVLTGWPGRSIVVDGDNGDLVVFSMEQRVRAFPVGPEPTRIVRDRDHLFVTLRGSGEVVHLQDDGTNLTEIGRRYVGAEPYDVVLSADGSQVFVSLSMEESVVALDRDTLAEEARWATAGEPRWLAVTPDTGHIVVTTRRGALMYDIDPASGAVDRSVIPMLRKFVSRNCTSSYLFPRITGEIVVDEDWIYVPVLYVDNDLRASAASPPPAGLDTGLVFPEIGPLSPDAVFDGSDPINTMDDPTWPIVPTDDSGLLKCELTPNVFPISAWGASVPSFLSSALARFNPTLVLVPRGEGEIVRIATGSQVRTDPGHGLKPRLVSGRGPLSSLEISGEPGESWTAWMIMENMGALIAMDLDRRLPNDIEELRGYRRLTAASEAGSRAVRRENNGNVWVWSMIARTLESTNEQAIMESLEAGEDFGAPLSGFEQAPPSELDPQIRLGREYFLRSDLTTVTGSGSGVSCSVCHAEGRSDGITWMSDDFGRQTPVLAGNGGATGPFSWLGDVPTIAMEAELTVTQRLGGSGLKPEDYAAIQAYVASLRAPILPRPTAEEQVKIELGREVFHRPEVGCATCHGGPQGTSNVNAPLYGYRHLNTPQLVGLAASAPYLHDGSALTLRALLERSRDGSMGDTSSLTDEEMDALETFLRFF